MGLDFRLFELFAHHSHHVVHKGNWSHTASFSVGSEGHMGFRWSRINTRLDSLSNYTANFSQIVQQSLDFMSFCFNETGDYMCSP